MKKFMETSIPEIYSRGLDDEKCLTVGSNHVDKVATVLFTGVSNCLKAIKSKEKPAVFKFSDLKDDTIAFAVVAYHPNEDDKTKPGNWSYIWSFDDEDMPDDATVVNIKDGLTHPYFVSVAGNRYNMGFRRDDILIELMTYLLQTIKKYLIDNATAEDVTGVELDGVFQARSAIEDNEVVCSIEVIGETKAIIKSDEDIEV